jgi:predicted permease
MSERWLNGVDALAMSVRFALRSLRRTPGLSVGVILAFALGIGANSTVYQVIDRLLLRPPPQLREPETLRMLAVHFNSLQLGREINNPIRSYPELADYRPARSLAGLAGFNYSVHELTLTHSAGAQRIRGMSVTGGYFNVTGVRPALGRLLVESDDRAGAPRVVVLSHGFWRRQYGGSNAVLGQTVDFGQGPQTIVGVLPQGFAGVQLAQVDLWFPLAPYRSFVQGASWDQHRTNHWLNIVVRLRPGVPVQQAEAELNALFRAAYRDEIATGRYPADSRVVLASLVPGESPLAPPEVGVTRWLLAIALVVLLIACINITNLLLARGVRERRALGIRLALGVTRTRLIAQTLVEVTLFALLGGGLALLGARYGGAFLQRTLLPDYAWDAIGWNGSVVWVTLSLALLAGLAAALLPVLQLLRPTVLASLRASPGSETGTHSVRLRGALVMTQVALSVALLAGASLFLKSFRNATQWDLGIDLERAWFITLDINEFPEALNTFYARALDQLRAVPGVAAASASSTMPLYQRHGIRFRAEGWDSLPGRIMVHAVRGDYFAALGLRILQGRALNDDDVAGAPPAAVVSREMARTLYPTGALDRCLYIGANATSCTRIVGVAEGARTDGVGGEPVMQFYLASAQHQNAPQLWGFSVRAQPDVAPARVVDGVRRSLLAMAPGIRWVEITPFAEMVESQLRPWRLGATLFTLFGALALIVAILGLYAVMAFDVSQRTRELGIRAALGATPRGLLRLVVRRSLLLAGAGAAAGVLITIAFAPRLQTLLFHVPARDLVSLTAVCATLLAAGLLAAWLPGRRAARSDPLLALRSGD